MIKVRYFTVTTIVSDQKTSDRMPSRFCGVAKMPWSGATPSLRGERGLVPMSPKTTPAAMRTSLVALAWGPVGAIDTGAVEGETAGVLGGQGSAAAGDMASVLG